MKTKVKFVTGKSLIMDFLKGKLDRFSDEIELVSPEDVKWIYEQMVAAESDRQKKFTKFQNSVIKEAKNRGIKL